MKDFAQVIASVCGALTRNSHDEARAIIERDYPFAPVAKTTRRYTPRIMTSIFLRDGFVDRYRKQRLVFPPTLRLISHALPDAFPYHPNGKMTVGHMAYWELFPTIDHVTPVARGGRDEASNWVCCSMRTNQIKAHWTMDELGWTLHDPGDCAEWDGLLGWFIQYVESQPAAYVKSAYVAKWYAAAKSFRL